MTKDEELKNGMGVPFAGVGIVDRLVAAGRALGQAITAPGCAPVVVVPDGENKYRVEVLPPEPPLKPLLLTALPDHVRQVVTLTDLLSFVQYVNGYKTGATRLFGRAPLSNPNGTAKVAEVLAVMDYHAAPDPEKRAAAEADPEKPHGVKAFARPRRCAHRAGYPCPFSEAWLAWSGIHRVEMDQGKFVDFLEDNMEEVVEPAGADLLELASNFKSTTNVKFAAKIDRGTGGVKLRYEEEPEMGSGERAGGAPGTVKIIEGLSLFLPVFHGGNQFTLKARIRWRVDGGKLKVTVVLDRPQSLVLTAFAAVLEEVSSGVGQEVLLGAPEQGGAAGSW